MPSNNNPQPRTGRYDMTVINGGHSGHFAVESEPGRSIVLSRGDNLPDSSGTLYYHAKSRMILDARDIPRLVTALQHAEQNALAPVACPNGDNA